MWLCQSMSDFRSSLSKFPLCAAVVSNQIHVCIVPHVYRYCLQAPRVSRAWLLRGSQVYHPVAWPCCHCWIYHQAAVLSSWIPKGQTDICMVNRIHLFIFLCLDLVCFWCKDVKSAVTVTVSVILIDEPHIWVFHTEPCGGINITARKICCRMRAGLTLECLIEVSACLPLFLEGCGAS